MRKFVVFCLCLSLPLILSAQGKTFNYTPAQELQLVGKASSDGGFFHRVDTLRYNDMPAGVKRLFTQSAGLAVSFVTDATSIKARWTVPNKRQGGNMSPIMQKGLDLYVKRDGVWQYAGTGSPNGVKSERTLVGNMEEGEKECLLYLPLYDEVTSVEVGVEDGFYLRKGANPFNGRIVVYGSSITQGASASRPGMAYPSRLARSCGREFINMGLSGSGKMEASVARMLADIENVDAFILDCIPNPSAEEIVERAAAFVGILREKHPDVPIVFIQSIVRETGNFNMKARASVEAQNEAIEQQFRILRKDDRNIYLIKESDFIGKDHEGTIDGVHPNDLGFDRMIRKFKPALSRILKLKFR